jgi:hypothetical protein
MSPSNYEDMAWRCEEDTREILAAGSTVENQATGVGLIQRAVIVPFMAWVFAFALGLSTKA